MTTAIVNGTLQATVTATDTNTPNNRLKELRFGDFQSQANNAVVTRNGVPVANNQTVTLPATTTTTTFRVTRAQPGKATTVPLSVVDNCPTPWPTFVGGGTGAGF